MQKYLIATLLVVALASCAPASKDVHKKNEIASEYGHLESRKKSINAAQKVNIGQSDASFYYDNRLWSVKNESISKIDFSARRFTNAHIFLYDENIQMTEIYKKLVEHYKMKDAKLIESEFVNVNNSVVISNKIEGMVNRREVSILSYGFSGNMKTIIAHCIIYKSMLRSETEHEIIDFLNGLAAAG